MSIKDEGARRKLIMYVRERRQLWDPKHPKYKDPKDTQKSWMEIGELCRNTPERCQRTWKYMRDFYLAKRKKLPTTEICRRENWAFMDIMKFIDDVSKALPKPTVNVDGFVMEKLESTAYDSSSMQESQDEPLNHNEIVEDVMPPMCTEISNAGSLSPSHQEDPLGMTPIHGRNESVNARKNFKKAILREMRKGKDPDFQWLASLYPLFKEFKDTLKKERVKVKIHSLILDSLEEKGTNFSEEMV